MGTPSERDAGYHQEPLAGSSVRGSRHGAMQRTHPRDGRLLNDLHDHLLHGGLGSVSEILDADAPHARRGCFAQAWSVASMLEILTEAGPDRISTEDAGAG